MSRLLKSIHYYPVKSLSFSNLNKCIIKDNLGILNDRLFSISRNIDFKNAKLIEKFPSKRKLNNFLTLKNSPILNKYKFLLNNNLLSLFKDDIELISIESDDSEKYKFICDKLIELECSIPKPIFLLKNKNFPFFDTTHSTNISNSISLINIKSIKDLEKNINKKIEFQRFRGNLYIDGIYPWEERNWINKIITINKVPFKVEGNIPRCSATNLQPNTDKVTINLPMTLKKYYDHIDMGVYLTSLQEGEINIGDRVMLDE